MATTTIQANQTRALLFKPLAGDRVAGATPVYGSSDETKVAIEARFPDRVVVRGVAAGTSNVTATVGAVVATCAVTVIAAGALTAATLEPGF